MLVMSGRTPLTETGRPGHRITPIHYGQEMFDQTSLVRDAVKYSYELRYSEQAGELVARALALAASAPSGPVYLSLPREPLAEALPDFGTEPLAARPAATPAAPDPAAVRLLADWLRAADRPMVICQRGDPAGRLGQRLAAFATRHGIGVSAAFATRNVLPSEHPNFLGFLPSSELSEADLVIVLDSGTPWIPASQSPSTRTNVAHIGPDPHFARMPVRGHRIDLAVQADPVIALDALDAALVDPLAGATRRNATLARAATDRQVRLRETVRVASSTDPMGSEWLSHCIGQVMGDDGVVFSDLGALPGFLNLAGPNRFFNSPHSGGLGWAMNAALGAQLADRERLVIAAVGDGSYIFANPVAAHQIAEALRLPILTIVKTTRCGTPSADQSRPVIRMVRPCGATSYRLSRWNRCRISQQSPTPARLMLNVSNTGLLCRLRLTARSTSSAMNGVKRFSMCGLQSQTPTDPVPANVAVSFFFAAGIQSTRTETCQLRIGDSQSASVVERKYAAHR